MNNEIKEILDYLSNDNIEKPFGMATIDKHKLLDYITNLQKENERLKTKTKEQSLLLIDYQDMEQKLKDYKSRIEKAVEYIKEHIRINDEYPLYMYMLIDDKHELLNILNGKE